MHRPHTRLYHGLLYFAAFAAPAIAAASGAVATPAAVATAVRSSSSSSSSSTGASSAAGQQKCSWKQAAADHLNTMAAQPSSTALVLGGTGAVGHHIVQQLLASNAWGRVVTLGRREVPLPPGQPGTAKLQQVVLSLEGLQEPGSEAAAAFRGVDAVFCALGTTRGAAGSAAAFKKVDYTYVATAAAAAKAAGVRWFGLVSAQGANAAVPASDFVLLHPLLYTQTKGRAEATVKEQAFDRTAIVRPGLLHRGDMARTWERVASPLLFGIPVSDVARVMVADAQAFVAAAAAAAAAGSGPPQVEIVEMAALKQQAARLLKQEKSKDAAAA